ncbi:MAG: DNA-binding protein WhiA [Lachnospiraceae bacterium]|nr:DNA-binding protein WhiA [Lachnospiraceae bacterium]
MSFSSDVKEELRKLSFTSSPKAGNIGGGKRGAARLFLRDSFLACGHLSDPEKGYHLEFTCDDSETAEKIRANLDSFQIRSGITVRKGKHVVYVKESESIAEFLSVTGAHQSMMELENLRIVKSVRSDVNRRVNCDTANIRKMLQASERQIEDIRYVERHMGLGRLSEPLRLVAELRLEHPELNLQELGEMLEPPVGKSGINHRLRKISGIAEELRRNHEEDT